MTITDTTPPDITVENFSAELPADGVLTIGVEDLIASVTDNCYIAETALSQTDFNCDHLGENEVTLYATDINGNESSQTFTVTINDVTPPIIEVQDIELFLNEDGFTELTGDFIVELYDVCGLATVGVSDEGYSCDDIGVVPNIITVLDEYGNMEITFIDVTIIDNISPTLSIGDVALELDENGEAVLTFDDIDTGSDDNCGIETVELSQTQFDCENVGNHTIDVTITDISGNSTSGSVVVTVQDNTAPVLVANEMIIELNENGVGEITEADLTALVIDNCDLASISTDLSVFDCSNIGTVDVIVTAIDASDNLTFETITVAVVDVTPPSLSISTIQLELDEQGTANLILADHDSELGDNCSIESIALSQSDFTCEDLGVQSIDVTITDPSGNVSESQIEVTITDTNAPVALVSNIEIELDDTGNASISFEDIDNGSTDNCGIATTSLSQSLFSCEDIGENIVSVELNDAQGNSTQTDITVTVSNPDEEFNMQLSLDELGQMDGDLFAYQVNFLVESICGVGVPNVIITVPHIEILSNITLIPAGTPERYSISVGEITVEIIGDDVQSLFDMVIENGGIPVQNGQIIFVQNVSVPTYQFYFEEGQLVAVTGPIIELLLEVRDPEGNIVIGTDEVANAVAGLIASSEDDLEKEPKIYPVPTSSTFNVQFPENISSESVRVSLYNILGREVESLNVNASDLSWRREVQIGSPELEAGYYMIRIQGDGLDITKKVLKTK